MIWEILKRRWWVLVLVPGVALATTAYLSSRMTPIYEATSVLIVDYRRPVQGDASGEVVPAGLQPNYLNTLVGVILSRPVAIEVVERLGLASSPDWQDAYAQLQASSTGNHGDGTNKSFLDWAVGILLDNVWAADGKRNTFLAVTYQSGDPVFSAKAANAFADAFQQITRDFEVKPALESVQSSDSIVEELREKLEAAQRRLSEYQRETGIVATDERLDIEMARLSELAQSRLDAEAAARAAESYLQSIESLESGSQSLSDAPEVLQNDRVRSLQVELGEKQRELTDLSTQLGPNHPNYRKAAAQVGSLKRELNAAVTSAVAGLRIAAAQAKGLADASREAEDAQREAILEFKSARDGMQALLGEVENANSNYERALELYSQYSIYADLNQTNVAILNEARPPATPSNPNWEMNLALALLTGILLGPAVLFLWELLDGGVRSREQIEQSGELVVIGELPNASHSK